MLELELLAIVLLSAPWSVSPQAVKLEKAAPESEITFTTIGQLETPETVTVTTSSLFHRAAERVVVGPLVEGYTWAEFNVDGEFRRLYKRRGEGPGEFERVDRVVPLESGAYLVFGSGRVTILSPDWEHIDSRLLVGVPLDGFPLSGGGAFVAFMGLEGGDQTVSLLRFDETGSLVHQRSVANPGLSTFGGRVAHDPRSGMFYFASAARYEIVATDTLGETRKIFRREPDWFPEPEEVEWSRSPVPRSLPLVLEFFDGRLWLLYAVRNEGAQWGGFREIQEFEARHSFVLEVIDPGTGTVVATETYDRAPFHGASSGGLFVHLDEDPATGLISPDLVVPSLNP